MQYSTPELLIPAGSLDKLKVAVQYGSDALYLGGQQFGLRSAADNFTVPELRQGVAYAHSKGVRVYVVLNSFLHDEDLEGLPSFLKYLEQLNVDAVIVSDLGVIETVKSYCRLPIHLSTQASCLNSEAARWWRQMGVKRLILGREVSVEDAGFIKKDSGLEVELFIHGSMCMAYSGHCVISNFTQGRDSNRGGCAHSCRFEYSFQKPQNTQEILVKNKAFFMSSKDLAGLRLLPRYIENQIDSVKVEGRMKGHLYAASTAKVYSEALEFYKKNGHLYSNHLEQWARELEKVAHRDYTTASLLTPADESSIFDEREHHQSEYCMAAIVLEVSSDWVIVQVRNAFNIGDQLEVLPFNDQAQLLAVESIENLRGVKIERTRPSTVVRIPRPSFEVRPNNLIRMRKRQ